jgi:hypothetical protein
MRGPSSAAVLPYRDPDVGLSISHETLVHINQDSLLHSAFRLSFLLYSPIYVLNPHNEDASTPARSAD